MSRIGRKPIVIPKGVSVKIEEGCVYVKGGKGELNWRFPEKMSLHVTDDALKVERQSDSRSERALHGLTRSLINNMFIGVSNGFTKEMELAGVGYRATVNGERLEFAIGYSHPVQYMLPNGISAGIDKKQTKLTLTGIDKQLLGQVAANIRNIRPPDAYKGKGIRYANERIKLKPGKTGSK